MPSTYYTAEASDIRRYLSEEFGVVPEREDSLHLGFFGGDLSINIGDRQAGVLPTIYMLADAPPHARQVFKSLKTRFGTTEEEARRWLAGAG